VKGRWRYARCGEPKRSDTLSDEGQRPNVKEKRKLESRVQRQVARTVRRGAGRKGHLTDLARCLPYTIASNLLEANAVLPWQASGQSAQCFGPLLCATIGHTPACYARQCLLSTTYHAAEWRARTCVREVVTNTRFWELKQCNQRSCR
jgi:hypothetical protein